MPSKWLELKIAKLYLFWQLCNSFFKGGDTNRIIYIYWTTHNKKRSCNLYMQCMDNCVANIICILRIKLALERNIYKTTLNIIKCPRYFGGWVVNPPPPHPPKLVGHVRFMQKWPSDKHFDK